MATTITFELHFIMNDKQKLIFLTYDLDSLTDLDLKGQNIDDNFLKELCDSGNLKKIRYINLIDNENLTSRSLKYLFRNKKVGSEGFGSYLSGKYGMMSVKIVIEISSPNMTKDKIKSYQKPLFDFYFRDLGLGRTYQAVREFEICNDY